MITSLNLQLSNLGHKQASKTMIVYVLEMHMSIFILKNLGYLLRNSNLWTNSLTLKITNSSLSRHLVQKRDYGV
jgi:hypothetical protein